MTSSQKFLHLLKITLFIFYLIAWPALNFSKNLNTTPRIIYRAQIKPFLIPVEILTTENFHDLPIIIAPEHPGDHNEIYVQGLCPDEQTYFSIYHPEETLLDPDTKENLGIQARYVGKAQLSQKGNPAKLLITQTQNEIQIGDRLINSDNTNDKLPDTFTLRPPAQFIKGRILTVVNRGSLIGQYDIVAINRGNRAHLREGDLLNIEATPTPTNTVIKQTFSDSLGKLMIFKTNPKTSWGLILSATLPIHVGDIVSSPLSPTLLKQNIYHAS